MNVENKKVEQEINAEAWKTARAKFSGFLNQEKRFDWKVLIIVALIASILSFPLVFWLLAISAITFLTVSFLDAKKDLEPIVDEDLSPSEDVEAGDKEEPYWEEIAPGMRVLRGEIDPVAVEAAIKEMKEFSQSGHLPKSKVEDEYPDDTDTTHLNLKKTE